jgi:hypothetical protein
MAMANRFGWKEFNIPIQTLISKSKLTKNDIYKSRNKLKQLGILEFKERSGNQSSVYKMISIVSLYGTQIGSQSMTQIGSQISTQSETQIVNIHKTKNQKPKTKNKESIANAIPKKVFGEFGNVLLKETEFEKLNAEYGEEAQEFIEYLSSHIEMKGYKAKSHYLAIKKWVALASREKKFRESKLREGGQNYAANRNKPRFKATREYPE